MRDGRHAHAVAVEGVEQLGHRVCAVAQAQAGTQGHEAVQAGAEQGRGQHGQVLRVQAFLRFGQGAARRVAQCGEQGEGVATGGPEVVAAVHQHGHALLGQVQGQQGHEVQELARAVERGQQHHALRVVQALHAGLHGVVKAQQFVHRPRP